MAASDSQNELFGSGNQSPLVASNFHRFCFQEGGTVKNILSPDFHPIEDFRWFVLRVAYGKERETADMLRQQGFCAYVPTHSKQAKREGQLIDEIKSWIPNTLFLYCHKDDVRQFHRTTLPVQGRSGGTVAANISFLYDHTRHNAYGLDLQMTVPFAEMINFIRLIETQDRNVQLLQSEEQVSRIGEEVEVTEGRFQGIRGRVARFRKHDVVLVRLSGVCLVTTAYIPRAFLRPASSADETVPVSVPESAALPENVPASLDQKPVKRHRQRIKVQPS